MGKITLDDTPLEGIVKMAEGNVGAVTVLSSMMKDAEIIDPQAALGGLGHILAMDDMGIYGSHIWILFKYVCNQDLRSMIAVLRAHQLGFISNQDIKNAILSEEKRVKHSLDVSAIVAQVESELKEFQKTPVTQ